MLDKTAAKVAIAQHRVNAADHTEEHRHSYEKVQEFTTGYVGIVWRVDRDADVDEFVDEITKSNNKRTQEQQQ